MNSGLVPSENETCVSAIFLISCGGIVNSSPYPMASSPSPSFVSNASISLFTPAVPGIPNSLSISAWKNELSSGVTPSGTGALVGAFIPFIIVFVKKLEMMLPELPEFVNP